MSTTGGPSIEAAERLQGRTVEDSAAKQLPVPNVPDLSAFDMNGNLHMTSESMEKLHQASVETQSIMQKYRAAMREMQVRLEILDQDLNLKKQSHPPYRKPSEDSCEHLREDRALRVRGNA